jgi:hypothetical protein
MAGGVIQAIVVRYIYRDDQVQMLRNGVKNQIQSVSSVQIHEKL